MIQGNYDNILGKISKASGLTREEVERMIEAKRAKLSGLISKEGAAQVVAAELGVSFANEKLKINELLPGMKKVSVIGKIINIFPVREFNKNGRSGKVANFVIADETSNIKIVLWDVNHIELIEKKSVDIGHVVEISNGSMRDYELHLGSFSDLKKSDEILEEVKTQIVVQEKNIVDFKMMDKAKTRAFIVQIFDPKFFVVCPECKKKLTNEGESFVCEQHGKIIPEKRALLNIVIDDGTETIRSVLFHENVSSLLTDLENVESLIKQKQELLGKEMSFSGSVRNNKIFNNPEFVIDKIEEINLDELIQQLEKQ